MSTFKTERRKGEPRAQYDFEVVTGTFEMPDGVKLASTTYLPVSKRNGEKFPVLLEVLPYRKDDTFYISDYPSYSYFARHGFITVKIDIRGTGGSTGVVPPREYSDVELDDIEEVIRQLSELPESNGSIGMWGVSWSGFNSLQVAMRRPPALKALLVMHSSDDLYQDDLHYIDGALHLDPYHLFINHELGLPRTPDYVIDRTYFKSRFERTMAVHLLVEARRRRFLEAEILDGGLLCHQYSRIRHRRSLGWLQGYRNQTPGESRVSRKG